MPFKPGSLSRPVDGDLVKVDFFNNVYDLLQDFINKGIKVPDISTPTGGWVDVHHIYRPDFYGSPAPRVEGVSGDTHYRETGAGLDKRSIHHATAMSGSFPDTGRDGSRDDAGWVYVRGLAATFRVDEDNTPFTVMTTFEAFEQGGDAEYIGEASAELEDGDWVPVRSSDGYVDDLVPNHDGSSDKDKSGQLEGAQCAKFCLFVDGVRKPSTERTLFVGTAQNEIFTRKQFSIFYQGKGATALDTGMHSIGVMVKVRTLDSSISQDKAQEKDKFENDLDNPGESLGGMGIDRSLTGIADRDPDFTAPNWKHIFVGPRSIVIDVHAL